MRNGIRVIAQQHADLVFLEGNLAFQFGNACGCCGMSRLSAGCIQLGSDSAFETVRKETHRLRERFRSLPGDIELKIQVKKLEVGLSDMADERQHNCPPGLFGCRGPS